MTKDNLNKIFQEAHQEFVSEMSLEKLIENFKQSLKDTDNLSTNEIVAAISLEMFYLNQKFLFKVLEKVLVDKNWYILSAILSISNVISGWAFISFKSSAISFGVTSIIIFIKSLLYLPFDLEINLKGHQKYRLGIFNDNENNINHSSISSNANKQNILYWLENFDTEKWYFKILEKNYSSKKYLSINEILDDLIDKL